MDSPKFDPQTIGQLSALGLQYGPFFFSVLFLVVMTWWAGSAYRDSSTRLLKKEATPKEVETRRFHFLSTFMFGLLLTTLSVLWWITHSPLYVYAGRIVDLKGDAQVWSQSVYFSTVWDMPVAGDSVQNTHDERFLVIQNRPFGEGDEFSFKFAKPKGTPRTLRLRYVSGVPEFEIAYDESKDEMQVQLRRGPKAKGASERITSALQEMLSAHVAMASPQGAQSPLPQMLQEASPRDDQSSTRSRWISALQTSGPAEPERRVFVGQEIEAIEQLATLSSDQLQSIADQSGPVEPVIVTLCDLVRHGDRELASKAKRLLARVDPAAPITRRLASESPTERVTGAAMLMRVEKPIALSALEKVPSARRAPEWGALKERVQSGIGVYLLAGSSSDRGDRYWVKAGWDPANEKAVACLAVLLKGELAAGSRRSLEEELSLMRRGGRSTRLIYWYEKSWSLDMAKRIEACGGTPSFPAF